MIRRMLFLGAISWLLFAVMSSGEAEARKVAEKFLPPGAKLAELVSLDSATGEPVRQPAVVEGQLISREASDLVFAYYTKAPDLPSVTLFVTILHKSEGTYSKVFEAAYYAKQLVIPEALRLIRLPNDGGDLLAVVTGFGASLGGQLQVFHWREPWGMINVMPENNSVRKVIVQETGQQVTITLLFEKYPGQEGVPAPISFVWDGERFNRERE